MTSQLERGRTRYAILAALVCCLLLPLQAFAKAHSLVNASDEVDKTWTGKCIRGTSGNGNCELESTASIAGCKVSKGGIGTLGGKNGDCKTAGCWFTSCDGVWTCPTKQTSVHVELGDMNQATDTTVVYPIWSAVDPGAIVAIYQSFIVPIRPQLIANAEFEVVGHDEDGDVILIDKETGVPMTDEDGNLFPEFVFEGELYPSGYVMAEDEEMDPEPAQQGRGPRRRSDPQ